METQFPEVQTNLGPVLAQAAAGDRPVALPAFDFRRPDRIPKSQIRVIQLIYDGFLRALATSLSAYLRVYVKASLASIDQVTYGEFLTGLSTPTCLVSLGLRPSGANAALQIDPPLVFPMMELLLGARVSGTPQLQREMTEIEQHVLHEIVRIVIRELREAWKVISPIEFEILALEKDPQMSQILDFSEPVVALLAEVRFGETAGLMRLALPSIAVKMMSQQFSQHRSLRRGDSAGPDRRRMMRLLMRANLRVEARLQGCSILIRDLMELKTGQVLAFTHPVARGVDCLINGCALYKGQMVAAGGKRGLQVEAPAEAGD